MSAGCLGLSLCLRLLLLLDVTPPSLSEPEAAIVFIHLGHTLPRQMKRSLAQAQLFNPSLSTFLLTTKTAYTKAQGHLSPDVRFVAIDDLPKSTKHTHFENYSRLEEGFWKYTTERFMYLESFMYLHQHEDVFHLESDNMIYTDLKRFLPTFRSEYKNKIAATFDNDIRVIPGFIYVNSIIPLTAYTSFLYDRITRLNAHDIDMVKQILYAKTFLISFIGFNGPFQRLRERRLHQKPPHHKSLL